MKTAFQGLHLLSFGTAHLIFHVHNSAIATPYNYRDGQIWRILYILYINNKEFKTHPDAVELTWSSS